MTIGVTSKTPGGRSATFRVQGLGSFVSDSFYQKNLIFHLFFDTCVSFHFLVGFSRFFTFGQVKSNARDGRSRHHGDINQSVRVCKVNLATLKVATSRGSQARRSHVTAVASRLSWKMEAATQSPSRCSDVLLHLLMGSRQRRVTLTMCAKDRPRESYAPHSCQLSPGKHANKARHVPTRQTHGIFENPTPGFTLPQSGYHLHDR